MNNTKWEEIRLAMYALGSNAPRWRTRDLKTQFLSPWDGEWFYHFSEGGYKTIEWLELEIETSAQEKCVMEILHKIHVPIRKSSAGVMVLGYISLGESVAYAGL